MITIWKTPIVATVEQVLKDLKLQLYGAGLLKEIKNTGSDLMCTCPFHANGKEHNPSCGVLLQQKVTKDKTYEAGTVHCYTCGYTADLPQFVADLLGLSSPVEGFKWLVNQYNYQTEERELPDLDMYRGSTAKSSVLEESLVKQYTQNLLQSEEACRYLHKRRIANWVLEAYELGFDPEDKTVLFPVRGMDGKVIFYKGRSIAGKHFYNAKEVDKTSVVFGLWEILNGSFSWGTSDQIEEVWITESEIDALSLISYGVPAVAIMGSHRAKKLFEDFAKECDIIYKKQQETFNTQHEKLKEQYRSGAIDWKKYNSLYKKLSKEVNEEADNERRALFGGGVSGLQDIYDAVSKGAFRDTGQVTYGHGSAYYTDRRRTNPNCSESLANYASLCVGHPELIDILAEDYPEIVTALRGCVEAMLKEVPK